ncbi:MAG TPA: immunoglobulin domain-containing protein, partial [Candidatus Dormibacteraeota bacterium]|nr:immunoglobulin domain-containing protein [Candidatus Dormibacteraeota bacterium]
ISRAATYTSDSTPVFSSGTIALVLESDSSPNEWAPTSPIVYTFESAPVALTTNLPLLRLTNSSWQANGAGTDLGTNWLDQSYDDTQAGWSAGLGLFGYTPSPGSYPPINKPLGSGPTTYYFRTHFNWNFLIDNVAFVVSNYLSDGAVFYLNGAEVRRVRMPAGTIGYNTNATGSASPVGVVEVFGIPGQPLIIGDNILEVETHQASGTAADMVFGLSLTAAAQYPVRNVNTNLPADQTVIAGQSVTFTSDVIGSGPLSYHWSHNGANIPGATNANLALTGVLTNDAGSYVLVTTNALGTNITRTALLTVTSTPVVINDPAQPADAFAVEGQPVTLSVLASGSPIVQYQWFKNNILIPDATNADYTIAFPALSNAGNYRATISNPAGSTNSRTASLTVLRDKVPPVITAVAAGASRIVVSFSWPV